MWVSKNAKITEYGLKLKPNSVGMRKAITDKRQDQGMPDSWSIDDVANLMFYFS